MIVFETASFYFIWNTITATIREVMDVLSDRQLKKIAEHKYSASGTSICEPPLQAFWRWLVEKLPLSWAPNSITLAGLLVNIGTSLVIFYYNPDGQQRVPFWGYLTAGVGLFVYQTLDALDGKQARRTNSSSPLGELFDHGCDAVSTIFVTLSVTLTMQLASYNLGYFHMINFFMFFLFYLAHWSTYCTGTLSFGRVDVIETQLGVIGTFFAAAVGGEDIFTYQIPVADIDVRLVLFAIMVLGGVVNVVRNLNVILLRGGSGRCGSTVAGTSVLFPVFPIATVILTAAMTAHKSPAVFQEHPCLHVFAFGMVFAKITCKLIVAHMSKGEFHYFDSVYIGPMMVFLNQYYNSFFSEYYILWASAIYSTVNLIYYCSLITTQLCFHLNVYCFSITSRPRPVAEGTTRRVLRSSSNKGTESPATSATARPRLH